MYTKKPMNLIVASCTMAVLLMSASSAHALDSDSQFQECRTHETLTVPVIQNGMDLVTVYANDYETVPTASGTFGDNAVDVKLKPSSGLQEQFDDYMNCDSPFVRVTQAQLELIAANVKPAAQPIAVFRFGFSNGADHLVVRPGINNPQDLSGKTVAVNNDSTSLDFFAKVVTDAQKLNPNFVMPTIVHVDQTRGLDIDSVASQFLENINIDAAFVKSSDAEILTSGGVGTGAEGSVSGAKTLLSTKSASRAVSHVLAVRSDFYQDNLDQVQNVVQALLDAEEKTREDVLKQIIEWDQAAEIVFGDGVFADELRSEWAANETVGLNGNREFTDRHPRNYNNISAEMSQALLNMGLIASQGTSSAVDWDWDSLGGGLFDTRDAQISGFDNNKAADAITDMTLTGNLEDNTLASFEIRFKPNQKEFPTKQYADNFARVVELVSSYAGAVLTVEGHVDPTRYLVLKYKEKQPANVLKRQVQSTDSLSLNRAQSVRDTILEFADAAGVSLDKSQFVVDGRGIQDPKTGICGRDGVAKCPETFQVGDPAPPRSKEDILSNMRVVFRMINVEAEQDVLTPVVDW